MIVPGKDEKRSERGATMVEYALMVIAIAITCLAGVANISTATKDKMNNCSLQTALKGQNPGC